MAMLSTRANLLLMPMLALASGCAPDGSFPSLAPRSVERLSTDEPVRVQPAVPADPALSSQVAELLARARRGQSEFQSAVPAARASVGRAGAPGSDAWVEAQQAVSRLEGARAETAAALTQLDSQAIERAARPTNAADFQALIAALDIAQSLADAQKAEIGRLQRQLRPI